MDCMHFHIESFSINSMLRFHMEMELGCLKLTWPTKLRRSPLRLKVVFLTGSNFLNISEIYLDYQTFICNFGFLDVFILRINLQSIFFWEWIAVHVSSQIDWTLITIPTLRVFIIRPISTIEQVRVLLAISSTLNFVHWHGREESCHRETRKFHL